jgi:hypothetical protein
MAHFFLAMDNIVLSGFTTFELCIFVSIITDSKESKQYTRFIIPPIILIIVGCIWLLKINGFRYLLMDDIFSSALLYRKKSEIWN